MHEDGTLSEEEHHWLTMRAEGGFGCCDTDRIGVANQGDTRRRQIGAAHTQGGAWREASARHARR